MIKNFLISFTILLSLDYLWFGIVMQDYYAKALKVIVQSEENQLIYHWPAALLVYMLLAAGLTFFVLNKPLQRAFHYFLHGAGFGLILYGVYNLTNYATIQGWPFSLVCLEILWGTFVCALASWVAAIMTKL